MPSRQDQLHSYQYSVQRVVAALVTHDPDPSRSPLRRAGTTALVSLLIAAIAVGGAGLYGLLTGQSSVDATDTNVVFQEKGTGARFVYLDGKLHPVQEAFHDNHALQCGYCTPGMIMQSIDLLSDNPDPTEEEVREGIEGNLCRCTGYQNIVKAVQAAASAGAQA